MDDCYDLPDLTLDLMVLQYSSWVFACASSPCGEFVLCLCQCSLLALTIFDSTSLRPTKWYKSCYVCVWVSYFMDMLFSFKNKYHYTYPNTYMFPALLPHFLWAVWNDWFGCVEARLSVKGGEWGSGG